MNTPNRRTGRGAITGPVVRPQLAAALLLVSLGAVSCRDTQIRAYTVPKSGPPRAAQAPPEVDMTPQAVAHGPAWDLPAGWQQIPGTGMRYATIVVEPAGGSPERPQLEIRVTPLAMAAGEILGNVNRWRGQVGLSPITEAEVGSVVRTFSVDGHPARLVNLTGVAKDGAPPQQILAAMLTSEPQIWFFFMVGDTQRMSKYAAPFEAFIKSVRLHGAPDMVEAMPPGGDMPQGSMPQGTMPPGAMPPGVMPPGAMPPGALPPGAVPPAGAGETMTWTVPQGWTQDPNAGDMRVALFHLPGTGGEATITRFPGEVGGLLANINRWRKQLAMEPVANPEEQPSESVMVAGQPARFYDISQPGGDGARKRMLVVLLARPDMTWFVKLTGPATLLDQQAAAFRQFLTTIRLGGTAG